MLLSIVSGTFNRLPYLRQMVASARACIPRGMAYEFVLVDGGSTDGTLDWCKEQSDIHLIEHGELKGAIRAFTDAGNASRGDYCLIANDDVILHANSIIPAIVHLETNPMCGAIAYMDNRPAPGYGDGYKVQTMRITDTDGSDVDVPYVQIGMYRNWLAKRIGYWGADAEMASGHTYGADVWMSARCYQFGYTIATLPPCKVDDLVPPDELRAHNYAIEQQNPGVYYKVFPTPPQFVSPPAVVNPQVERLRVLYMPIFEPHEAAQQLHKRGLREALARQGLVYEIDYTNTRYNLAEAVKAYRPHVLLMQCHAPTSVGIDKLKAAREANPSMIVVNWNGDVYEQTLTSPEMMVWLKHVDLQLTVNANVLKTYAQAGIPAAYWQVAYEPVDYDRLPDVPAHDVVFLANCYSDWRRQLGTTLQSTPGVNVGVYGRGWQYGNGDCTYNFPVSTALYQRAKIAIGDNQYVDQFGFVSNRIFEVLASGGFLLHQTIPGLEQLTGLIAGAHYVEWHDLEDLQVQINHWLQPRYEEQRQKIAAAGQAYVREHHTFDRRVQELFQLIQAKVGKGEAVA